MKREPGWRVALSKRTTSTPQQDIAGVADNLPDAIALSLAYRNNLDLPYMAKLLGKDEDTLREQLLQESLVYENPVTGLLEHPDRYLTGYVLKKLREARLAAQTDPRYQKNVDALLKAAPPSRAFEDIGYSLASHWMPNEIFVRFLKTTLNVDFGIDYSTYFTDKWSLPWGAAWCQTFTARGSSAAER